MGSIQLRNVPDDLYEEIAKRAKEENRTIPQQTISILKANLMDLKSHRLKRKLAFERASKIDWPPVNFDIAKEIRKDRDSR